MGDNCLLFEAKLLEFIGLEAFLDSYSFLYGQLARMD